MNAPLFPRVLVPVQFEDASDRELAVERSFEIADDSWVAIAPATVEALRLAAKMAQGGEIRLVHATPDLTSTTLYGGPEGTWLPHAAIEELDTIARNQSLKVLRHFAGMHCGGARVAFDVDSGKPLHVILEAAQRHPPDVIVLATGGRGKIRRAVLGSTADKLIRQAVCPVVVVPAER